MVHSLSHALGGLAPGLHHGTLNAMFLPHVIRFNMDACLEMMQRMAVAVGVRCAQDLPEYFTDLVVKIGLPIRLNDAAVGASFDLDHCAELAMTDHCRVTNPKKFGTVECRAILSQVLIA
jgi:alcohol dehydrogenase class IV